jgi:hypothetical protein
LPRTATCGESIADKERFVARRHFRNTIKEVKPAEGTGASVVQGDSFNN